LQGGCDRLGLERSRARNANGLTHFSNSAPKASVW
jgi:hypothetical protein